MSYSASADAETRTIQSIVDRDPEASAADVAQIALDELWTDDGVDEELDLAYARLERRAREEWACP